jgi:hypothetical protein
MNVRREVNVEEVLRDVLDFHKKEAEYRDIA